MRKAAETEVKRQMARAGGYTLLAVNQMSIPETQIMAVLNSSGQKILQQCQQAYLLKQIDKHVCCGPPDCRIERDVFFIDGVKHVLDYLASLRLGKKPS